MQNRAASPARESYESTTQAIKLIGAQWAFKPRHGGAATRGCASLCSAARLFVEDDNELNMKLFHDLLEAHGYHPIARRHGGARSRPQAPSRFDPDGHSAAGSLRSRSDQVAQGRPLSSRPFRWSR